VLFLYLYFALQESMAPALLPKISVVALGLAHYPFHLAHIASTKPDYTAHKTCIVLSHNYMFQQCLHNKSIPWSLCPFHDPTCSSSCRFLSTASNVSISASLH
jgi:hypothetical protein